MQLSYPARVSSDIGGFIGTERFGAFLAVADRADPRFRHAKRDEIVLGGVGATFAQRQVVIAGAAFVGMPLDRDANIRIGHQPLCLALQSRLLFCADVIFVSVQADAVGRYARHEIFLASLDGAGGWRRGVFSLLEQGRAWGWGR